MTVHHYASQGWRMLQARAGMHSLSPNFQQGGYCNAKRAELAVQDVTGSSCLLLVDFWFIRRAALRKVCATRVCLSHVIHSYPQTKPMATKHLVTCWPQGTFSWKGSPPLDFAWKAKQKEPGAVSFP